LAASTRTPERCPATLCRLEKPFGLEQDQCGPGQFLPLETRGDRRFAGIHDKAVHLLHVARGRWMILQMRERILALAAEWNVDMIIVEDTSSGMGLIQLLKEQRSLSVVGRRPKDDKESA
jgi:hypothetical protein